jgi:hypothetical protein
MYKWIYNKDLLVKVSDGTSMFWVRVKRIRKGLVHGWVTNVVPGYKFNELVKFPAKGILEIADWDRSQ